MEKKSYSSEKLGESMKEMQIDGNDLPFSSPKRKLMEAKERDAYFERESKTIEATRITKEISKQFVSETITNVLENAPFLQHKPQQK